MYFGLILAEDSQSARWMVFLSEWLAIVAGRFLRYAHEARLFILPNMGVEWLRRLNLRPILGSPEAQLRLQVLLSLHGYIDWSRIPYTRGHHFDNPRSAHYSSGRQHDVGRPDRGNWVQLESGTLRLGQPEFMRGGEGDAAHGGGGGRPRGVGVVERGGEGQRVRPRGVGCGKGRDVGRDWRFAGGPASGEFILPQLADVVMSGGGETEGHPPEGAERRDSITMTDEKLRVWIQNRQWRAPLHFVIAEETSGTGEVAAEVPAVVALAAPSSTGGEAVAAVSPTVHVSVGLVPPGERLPEPPQVEKSGAFREEDLADYEEGGIPYNRAPHTFGKHVGRRARRVRGRTDARSGVEFTARSFGR